VKRLLLHTCCAPCSTWSIETLKGRYEVTSLFYNPNIQPREEYDLRLSEAMRYCSHVGVDLLEGTYDVHEWERAVSGHEDDPEGGERCGICFSMRLKETARLAAVGGYDAFTTTLTISPHKDAKTVNSAGEDISRRSGVPFIPLDLKKRNGFRKSVEMSREHELHRQDFCGCVYSRRSRSGLDTQKV
jgi:predicted adenine nucleotide alpha hydrolase (AANH) superfamily ATPase